MRRRYSIARSPLRVVGIRGPCITTYLVRHYCFLPWWVVGYKANGRSWMDT